MNDVDLVIYEPDSFKVIAILSSKVTLRERIAQTGYWKLKLHKARSDVKQLSDHQNSPEPPKNKNV